MKLHVARYCIGAILGLFFAIPLLLALSGCGPARNFKTAVIDCTKASQPAIAALVAEFEPLLHITAPDWQAIERKAIAAGVVIGGCALVAIVTRSTAPQPTATVLPERDAGRETLEHFRVTVAGGAQFLTADGPR
jgi:hypothetical protein